MLKNKEERKSYLLNEDNWEAVYNHPGIFTTVKQMILPDGTIIIREDIMEKDEFQTSMVQIDTIQKRSTYRIVRSKYLTPQLSITFLVDLLGKIKV